MMKCLLERTCTFFEKKSQKSKTFQKVSSILCDLHICGVNAAELLTIIETNLSDIKRSTNDEVCIVKLYVTSGVSSERQK